jgi:hypothetical protein
MRRRDAAAVGTGAAIGLAWATSLRAWMAHLAIEFSDWPRYTWEGTFLAVLLPAVLVGALIGLDWQRCRTLRGRVPLVAWSPLLLVVAPALVSEDFIGTLIDSGEGSGAIAVVVIGMCGGLALSGRGPVWGRALAGLAVVGVTAVMTLMLAFRGQVVTASGVFGAVHLGVLLAWLAVGCSLPMRRHTTHGAPVPAASGSAAGDDASVTPGTVQVLERPAGPGARNRHA